MRENVEARNRLIGDSHMDWRTVLDDLREAWTRMRPWVRDVSVYLAEARRAGTPCSTRARRARCSTSITARTRTSPRRTAPSAASAPGLGVPPRAIDGVLGVTKAYTTRVGDGPFPSELLDATGERLRAAGHEFGAVTGRPRRCGWFDAVVVRHAVRVNGLDALALTKLDVLDGFTGDPDLRRLPRRRSRRSTSSLANSACSASCTPILETMPGWTTPTAGVRRFDDLPAEARAYIARIEALVGVPAAVVSTGADRDDTIVRDDSVVVAAGSVGVDDRRAPRRHASMPRAARPSAAAALVKRYADVVAVDGLDLDIARGECFGLLGPNGAGKTTTIEILEGLLDADSGDVEVLGRAWRRDAQEHPRAHRHPAPGDAAHREALGRRDPAPVPLVLRARPRRGRGPATRRAREQARRVDRQAVGRPEAARRARLRAGRAPRAALPRRADDGTRPAVATPAVGAARALSRRGRHHPPHHALHGRGRSCSATASPSWTRGR